MDLTIQSIDDNITFFQKQPSAEAPESISLDRRIWQLNNDIKYLSLNIHKTSARQIVTKGQDWLPLIKASLWKPMIA